MSQAQPQISDVVRWIQLLQNGTDDPRKELDSRDADAFETGLQAVAAEVRDHPTRVDEASSALLQLVHRYQSVDKWLLGKDDAYEVFRIDSESHADPAASVQVLQVSSAAAAADATAPQPTEGILAAHARRPAALGTQVRPAAISDTNTSQQTAEVPEMQGAAAREKGREPWTPEFKMQLFKELFTALLALVIIGFTLMLALRSFSFVGDTKKVGDAKDLLTIMLGLAGVVVGYYFGRVPGEARAAEATNRADEAVSQREQIKGGTRVVADHLDRVIADSARSVTRDPQAMASLAELQSLRNELHDLAGPAIP